MPDGHWRDHLGQITLMRRHQENNKQDRINGDVRIIQISRSCPICRRRLAWQPGDLGNLQAIKWHRGVRQSLARIQDLERLAFRLNELSDLIGICKDYGRSIAHHSRGHDCGDIFLRPILA